ncbi:stress responsive A/B barrel domain-containing protein [Thelonectria olida]|uniref:Stress responsive A/B barrel domain-containing protein n=1 Tax=Thelonectria olida TaxID=1576542 RepID=A0A9P8VS20_9HYPO|nr:stress responsive A/B barrel domain-containing protein [Thelonectria olida]
MNLQPLVRIFHFYRFVAGFILFAAFMNHIPYWVDTGRKIPTTHTVFVEFMHSAKPEAIKAACAQFKSLKYKCLHPIRHSTYIISVKGGRHHEDQAYTHAFITEFASIEDRDYFVNEDPAHKALKYNLEHIVSSSIEVDFTDGNY